MKALVLVLLLASAPVYADEPTPAWSKKAQPIADWISTGAVLGELAGATITSWRSPDPAHALKCEGVRIGVAVLVAELLKHAFPRWRPDHSDRLSFPSEHTAISFAAASGWTLRWSLPIGGVAGYGRMAANRHHPTDVVFGAGLGLVAGRLCQ